MKKIINFIAKIVLVIVIVIFVLVVINQIII